MLDGAEAHWKMSFFHIATWWRVVALAVTHVDDMVLAGSRCESGVAPRDDGTVEVNRWVTEVA